MIEKPLMLALAAAVVMAGWQCVRAEQYKAKAAQVQAMHQRDLAAMAAAAVRASASARTEEQRRAAAQKEIDHEAERFQAQAAAAVMGAATAAAGVRERAAALAAATYCPAPGDPHVVYILPPAAAPGPVLADVLGRIADHAVALAAIADQALIAGAACEAAYGALAETKSNDVGGSIATH